MRRIITHRSTITMARRFYLARIAFNINANSSTIEDTVLSVRDARHLDLLYPSLRKY